MQPVKDDDDDEYEWEEWDRRSSFVHHMVAGASAGVMEHVAMFPVDTIKTHVQAQGGSKSATRKLWMEGGFFRFWRGSSSMLMGCIPSHAAYFSVYEAMKDATGANRPGHHPLAAAMSGATATVVHDVILTPMDMVKQRVQLGTHRRVLSCIREVAQKEGIRAFYLSLPTTLLMNVPYAGFLVATNESLKEALIAKGFNLGFGVFLISGALAGGVAAAVTTPMDVVKTRLQTQDILTSNQDTVTRRKYIGAVDAVRRIYAEEGMAAFRKGLKPRLALHMPAAAISWTTYEMVKIMLSRNER